MPRSSWGLSTPTDEAPTWERRARCAEPDANPEWWSTPSGAAVHQCRHHCPVRAQCRQDVLDNPHHVKGTVRHGVFYAGTIEKPKPAYNQPVDLGCTECGSAGEMALIRELVCPWCGESFYPNHANERYCDEKCQKAAEYQRRKRRPLDERQAYDAALLERFGPAPLGPPPPRKPAPPSAELVLLRRRVLAEALQGAPRSDTSHRTPLECPRETSRETSTCAEVVPA